LWNEIEILSLITPLIKILLNVLKSVINKDTPARISGELILMPQLTLSANCLTWITEDDLSTM